MVIWFPPGDAVDLLEIPFYHSASDAGSSGSDSDPDRINTEETENL